MIISTFIAVICFIAVVFEILSMYTLFKSCSTVKCSVNSSRKIQERKDNCLINEYWKTQVTFTYRKTKKSATLQTSTYCQNGQVLTCYYYPKKDIIFRKRDLKNQFKSSSLIITTVGILFMFLNLLFSLSTISKIVVRNMVTILSIILIASFLVIGLGYVIYSIKALKNMSEKKVTKTEAKIIDVVRKSKRHKENEQFTYYPIYSYTFNNERHETQSKLKHSEPPKIGSIVIIPIDNKKAGPVEYNDIKNSLAMGICFILFAAIFVYSFCFLD